MSVEGVTYLLLVVAAVDLLEVDFLGLVLEGLLLEEPEHFIVRVLLLSDSFVS